MNPTLDREEDDVGNGGFATCDTKKVGGGVVVVVVVVIVDVVIV